MSGGQVWDAPNQQVVRADQSAPWDEGSGGGTRSAAKAEPDAATETEADDSADLDSMTKEQLLDYARAHEITPANAAMTKDEIRASIDAASE
jgi:hypothetical protein